MRSQEDADAVQPDDDASDERTNSEHKNSESVPSKSDSPPTITNKKKAGSDCDKGLQIATFVVEVLALFGLAFYACITYRMWTEMQTQTQIQRNTGINTERAWVGLDLPVTLDAIETRPTQTQIRGHYSLKNFGHGPAFKVMQSGSFVGTHESMEMQTREANFFCDSSVKFTTGTVPVGGEMKQPPPFGHTLFPGKGDSYPIEFQGPPETLLHLRFIGCVAYIDQFKAVHWTRFCMERRPGDGTPIPKLDFCAMYNDADEQPKN